MVQADRIAYVAGPYSGDVRSNILRAVEMGALLLRHTNYLPIIPHVSQNHATPWDIAMERDYEIMRGLDPACDIVVTLGGWEHSMGSCEEVKLAHTLGLTVKHWDEVLHAE